MTLICYKFDDVVKPCVLLKRDTKAETNQTFPWPCSEKRAAPSPEWTMAPSGVGPLRQTGSQTGTGPRSDSEPVTQWWYWHNCSSVYLRSTSVTWARCFQKVGDFPVGFVIILEVGKTLLIREPNLEVMLCISTVWDLGPVDGWHHRRPGIMSNSGGSKRCWLWGMSEPFPMLDLLPGNQTLPVAHSGHMWERGKPEEPTRASLFLHHPPFLAINGRDVMWWMRREPLDAGAGVPLHKVPAVSPFSSIHRWQPRGTHFSNWEGWEEKHPVRWSSPLLRSQMQT